MMTDDESDPETFYIINWLWVVFIIIIIKVEKNIVVMMQLGKELKMLFLLTWAVKVTRIQKQLDSQAGSWSASVAKRAELLSCHQHFFSAVTETQ